MTTSTRAVEGSSAPERSAWVDLARGIGIVLVVFGHAWRGLHAAAMPFPARLFESVDAYVYAFHMPLFFFISGLFIERSAQKPAPRFFSDKLRSIVYPYLVWSLLYGAASAALSRYTNAKLSIFDVVPSFLWRPYAHFWFLYVLLVSTLLYWALRKLRLGLPWVALFAALVYATDFSLGPWGVLYLTRNYFAYFALGALLGPWLVPRLAGVKPGLATFGSLLAFALLAALVARGTADDKPLVLLAALVGSAGVVLLGAVLSRSPRFAILALLGQWSLPIYLAHPLANAGSRIVLRSFLGVENLAIHVVAGTLFGLLFPIGLILVTERTRFPYLFSLTPAVPRPKALPRP